MYFFPEEGKCLYSYGGSYYVSWVNVDIAGNAERMYTLQVFGCTRDSVQICIYTCIHMYKNPIFLSDIMKCTKHPRKLQKAIPKVPDIQIMKCTKHLRELQKSHSSWKWTMSRFLFFVFWNWTSKRSIRTWWFPNFFLILVFFFFKFIF